jgi:hypothetical protein
MSGFVNRLVTRDREQLNRTYEVSLAGFMRVSGTIPPCPIAGSAFPVCVFLARRSGWPGAAFPFSAKVGKGKSLQLIPGRDHQDKHVMINWFTVLVVNPLALRHCSMREGSWRD